MERGQSAGSPQSRPTPARRSAQRPGRLVLVLVLLLQSLFAGVAAPAGAAAPFADVPTTDPAYTAINGLYDRGIIKGYPTTPPTFGPTNTSLRAQMAALIGRAMGWSTGGSNPFTDRCGPDGCVDDELWGYVATLAGHGVARGYSPTTYGPYDNVLRQQVILFISRAKVSEGAWVRQPDNPRLYPGSAGTVTDHQDIVTYVFYAGAPPDAPRSFDAPWGDGNKEATRGWFARALWQAYPEGKGPALMEPSTPNNDPQPNTAAFAAKVLELTNVQRQQNGCGPLTGNLQLQNAAQKHAMDMANQDYFSHTGKNGSTPDQRVTAEGYQFGMVAENIAAGQTSPESVVTGWMNSPGHRANILNCDLKQLGVGYFYLAVDTGTVNFNHYWVQVFGTPAQ